MSKIYVFPGQGAQFVGMGKELYENNTTARAVFDEVDDALNEKLSNIIFNGAMEELTLTKNDKTLTRNLLIFNKIGHYPFIFNDFLKIVIYIPVPVTI